MIIPIISRTELETLRKLELLGWQVLDGLSGLVLNSLEELRKLLPDGKSDNMFLREHENSGGWSDSGFDRYTIRNGSATRPVDIAYGCPECKKIIVGPPRVEIVDTIKGFCGRSGIDVYCTNCSSRIYEFTFDQS